MDRKEQFEEVLQLMRETFAKKNAEYGDDYFSGGY